MRSIYEMLSDERLPKRMQGGITLMSAPELSA